MIRTDGPAPGIRGVPPVDRADARAEIARLRAEGYSYPLVARSLNARKVPTPSGRGQWWPRTVRHFEQPEEWRDYMRRYRARQRRKTT